MPPLHPVLVHFPIALLTAGFLAEVCALLFKKSELSRAGWWSQLTGTIGLAAAVGSGLIAKEAAGVQNTPAGPALEAHEQWALWSMLLFAALLFWRIASRTKVPVQPRYLYMALYAIGVVALWFTAAHGGDLVYRLGVGVSVR